MGDIDSDAEEVVVGYCVNDRSGNVDRDVDCDIAEDYNGGES